MRTEQTIKSEIKRLESCIVDTRQNGEDFKGGEDYFDGKIKALRWVIGDG